MKEIGRINILAILCFLLMPANNLDATIYGKVQGKVIAEDTGKGLGGVEVRLYETYEVIKEKSLDDGTTYETIADKDGNYIFDQVKPSKYIIEFTPPEPYLEDLSLFYLEKEAIQVVIVEKGRTSLFNKIISIGGTISGTVYLKQNGVTSRLGYAALNIKQEDGRRPQPYISLPDGTYRFSRIALNEDIKLMAEFSGYGSKTKNLKILSIQGLTNIDFLFDDDNKTGIEVTVISSLDGTPLADAAVVVEYENKPLQKNFHRTNEIGKASIIDLEPGNYDISIYYTRDGKTHQNSKRGVFIEKGKITNIVISINLS